MLNAILHYNNDMRILQKVMNLLLNHFAELLLKLFDGKSFSCDDGLQSLLKTAETQCFYKREVGGYFSQLILNFHAPFAYVPNIQFSSLKEKIKKNFSVWNPSMFWTQIWQKLPY